MQKIRLLQAVCTVAMLASVPAFAQSTASTPGEGTAGVPDQGVRPPNTGQTSMPNHNNMSSASQGTTSTNTAATDNNNARTGSANDGLGVSAGETHHAQHRSAMAHSTHMMRSGKTDTSQDAAVNDLNNQSYAAAQKGQMFDAQGSGNGSGNMTQSGNMGQTHTMSSGSMSNGGSAGTTSKP